MGFDALVLATNLITGVIVARALGPAGRGELAAILILTQMVAWVFSMGSVEGILFRLSRHPEDGGRLLGSWFAVSAPLSIIAVAAGELALPALFAAQTEAAINLAQIYLVTVLLLMLQSVVNGVLLGDQDFYFYNIARIAGPGLIGISYACLWLANELSVESGLIVNATASGVALAVATVRALRQHGIAAPDLSLLRNTLWYGLRAHGGTITGVVNLRLDLLVMPAFLSATSVGLYSVAANVTSTIMTLTGTVALLVFPVAARQRGDSASVVIRTLHAVLAIGLIIAIPLAMLANFALTLLYGDNFGGAATALRLLLPGNVLGAGAVVLWSGLLAAGRPFLSTATEGSGALLTVVGLLLFLESGGIRAAAIVTSCAYVMVFVVSLALYRRVAGLRWRDFLWPMRIDGSS
jgi:O-antigen/teichoic acid export membrane protein